MRMVGSSVYSSIAALFLKTNATFVLMQSVGRYTDIEKSHFDAAASNNLKGRSRTLLFKRFTTYPVNPTSTVCTWTGLVLVAFTAALSSGTLTFNWVFC